MDKKEIIHILEEIGTLLELKGENPFKARAYYNAARTLETLAADPIPLIKSGEIADIKGIGSAISGKLKTLVESGQLPYHQELKAALPAGLLDLLKIPGLGPKKVKSIYEKLHIGSIGELEYACLENRLRDLDGFGQKSQDNILKSIEIHKRYSERYHFHIASAEASQMLEYLQKQPELERLEVAGSLRRKRETIKDIDIVASCPAGQREKVMDYFSHYPQTERVIAKGATKSTILLHSGLHCDLRLVDDRQFPFLLHHSTGSKEHNTAMRHRAKSMGLTMNEYGLFPEGKKDSLPADDEAAIFKALGLSDIPPELRENYGEIEAAARQQLPQLVEAGQLCGLFHVHTTYSDGAAGIKEMSEACRRLGFQFLGISDHSKAAFYANGLNEERVKQQQEEIDQLNAQFSDFVILKGIEVDILADGTLDYVDDVLASFDFVIASVHSSFKISEDDMTRRICRALANPYVTMLGHPTGRLLLGREAYPLNMPVVLETAAKYGRIVEINANPHRLDLDWRWGKKARELGLKTSINPDAHAPDGLNDYHLGLGIARKGWFEAADVVNTLSADTLKEYFRSLRDIGQ